MQLPLTSYNLNIPPTVNIDISDWKEYEKIKFLKRHKLRNRTKEQVDTLIKQLINRGDTKHYLLHGPTGFLCDPGPIVKRIVKAFNEDPTYSLCPTKCGLRIIEEFSKHLDRQCVLDHFEELCDLVRKFYV
jgi:hypothetical protein